MSSGNLYYLKDGIDTKYGKLYFIKVRKYDESYLDYRISVDFIVNDYERFSFMDKYKIIKEMAKFWKKTIEEYTNNNCKFEDGIFLFNNK